MFDLIYLFVGLLMICSVIFFITIVLSYFVLKTFPNSKVGDFVRSHIISDKDLEP